MDLIADILMTAGAFAAALYCHVLSRRLSRIQTLEGGLGGAIAVLSAQVDDMTRALERARTAAEVQSGSLEALVARGEAAAGRLEMLIAALHDLPEPDATAPPQPAAAAGDGREPAGSFAQAAGRRLTVLRRRVDRAWQEAAE